jgi:hypothetical protein
VDFSRHLGRKHPSRGDRQDGLPRWSGEPM